MKDNDQVKIYENYLAVGMQQMNEDEAAPSVGAAIGIPTTIDALQKLGHDMQNNVALYQGVIDSLKAMEVTAFAGLNVKALGILLSAFSLKLDDEEKVLERLRQIWANEVPEEELAAVNGDVDEDPNDPTSKWPGEVVPTAVMDQGQLPVGNLNP